MTGAGAPARRSALVGLLAAEAVSLTGTRLSMLALPWFVLVATGSAARTGLVAFAEMAPYVVAKALGGPAIDRLGPRRVSVTADVVSAVAVAAVPLLHAARALPYPVLLALVAVAGLARGPGDAAKATLVPGVAAAARVPVERVAGLHGIVERGASTIGAAAGGALAAWLGPLAALAVDATTFAVAALVVLATAPRGVVPGGVAAGAGTTGGVVTGGAAAGGGDRDDGYFRRLRAGLEYLRRDRLLRAVTGMIAVTNLIDAAMLTVVIPVWVRASGGGPAVIGALWTGFGIMAVAGSSVAAAIGHRIPRRVTYLVAFLVGGAPRIAVLALDVPLWLVVAVWAVAGCGAGLINPILTATMVERIPPALLGRVTALSGTLAWAGIPLGGPVAGLLLTAAGTVPTILIAAAGYLVATTLPGLRPEWREMDDQRGRPPVTAEQRGRPPVTAGQSGRAPVPGRS